jgi:hypothetical protein
MGVVQFSEKQKVSCFRFTDLQPHRLQMALVRTVTPTLGRTVFPLFCLSVYIRYICILFLSLPFWSHNKRCLLIIPLYVLWDFIASYPQDPVPAYLLFTAYHSVFSFMSDKTCLREVGCGSADWIDLAQDRDRWRALVYSVMNLRVPWNAGNFLSSLGHFSFSGRTLLHGVSKLKLVFIVSYSFTLLNFIKIAHF